MHSSTESPLHSISPHQYTLLMERAKQDALRLRREAIAAFWTDIARALSAALRRVQSSAFVATRRAVPSPR
jgi:hypothetical protein